MAINELRQQVYEVKEASNNQNEFHLKTLQTTMDALYKNVTTIQSERGLVSVGSQEGDDRSQSRKTPATERTHSRKVQVNTLGQQVNSCAHLTTETDI